MKRMLFALGAAAAVLGSCFAEAGRPLRSEPFGEVMSEAYWKIWNDDVQRKVDADIERNRKSDCEVAVDAPVGTEVKVEQIDSAF